MKSFKGELFILTSESNLLVVEEEKDNYLRTKIEGVDGVKGTWRCKSSDFIEINSIYDMHKSGKISLLKVAN